MKGVELDVCFSSEQAWRILRVSRGVGNDQAVVLTGGDKRLQMLPALVEAIRAETAIPKVTVTYWDVLFEKHMQPRTISAATVERIHNGTFNAINLTF